ncbi:MAG: hypothetical protein KJZ93_17905 [Caldilineaceae bacterium]|nr:hypothetical protein [Caldilineaceae bacterium]
MGFSGRAAPRAWERSGVGGPPLTPPVKPPLRGGLTGRRATPASSAWLAALAAA